MDFRHFQEKLVRRVASPVELIYVVTSHWFLIFLFIAIGTFLVLLRLSDEKDVYAARATLILQPPQEVVEKNFGRVIKEDPNFIIEQIRIMQSESVMLTLVHSLGYDKNWTVSQLALPGEDEEPAEGIGATLEALVDEFNELMSLIDPDSEQLPSNPTPDQLADVLRARCKVDTVRGSNQVKLRIVGRRREILETELEDWIMAYKTVLRRLTSDSLTRFFNDRIEYWRQETDEAQRKIDDFVTLHPDANPSMLRYIQEEVIRQQIMLGRLEMQFEDAMTAQARRVVVPEEKDPKKALSEGLLAILQEKLTALRVQRVELEGKYPEQSRTLTEHDKKIDAMESQIDRLKKELASDQEKTPLQTTIDTYQRSTDSERASLDELRRQQAAIENDLAQLAKLREDHSFKSSKLEGYESQLMWTTEMEKGRDVMVQVLDPPAVDSDPINSEKHLRVAVGALAGACIGLLLSFCLELFCRRIRFKKDIEQELGLEVVGVLPVK